MEIICKKAEKYNIDLDFLRVLPIRGHTYWKKSDGFYLGSNDLMMEKVKVASLKDLLTKKDTDFEFDENYSYQHEDKLVMENRQQMFFINSATTKGWRIDFFTIKSPLFDSDGNLAGIWGISAYLSELKNKKVQQKFDSLGLSFNLPQNNKEYYFSEREKEILFYLTRGKTAKETATILALSKRTIEHYIENIKLKFDVSKKSALIEKAINYLNFNS